MGRELQKKKNRSGLQKVRQKPKTKKRLLQHPIIAANWDKSQTLEQNYKRLGLTVKLNKHTGGVEKKAEDVRRAREEAEGPADARRKNDMLAIATARRPEKLDVQEARIERDPETGKILRVIEPGRAKANPLNDPLAELDSESEAEGMEGFNQHASNSASTATDASSGTEVVQKLEQEARKPTAKHKVKQSGNERAFIAELVEKHGDDYAAMARDMKVNYMQRSEGDLKRRVKKWVESGGSFYRASHDNAKSGIYYHRHHIAMLGNGTTTSFTGAPLDPRTPASTAISKPLVFGAEVLNLTANAITNFEGIAGNDVCYVIVAITHPGTGDRVNNYIALPLSGWNGRFQGIGGGGYATGTLEDAANQTVLGYSTGATDAGHDTTTAAVQDASPWALISPGNVNQYLLLNFAHRSLHDMTVIGKAVSESFYGSPVKYSYWNGCSTGGREGLALAQYYPSDYDGILADAPAVQWNDFTLAQQWPYTVENNEGYAPPPCELDAVVAAVIDACDNLDGLVDRTISAPGLCTFEAQSLVGKQYNCDTDGSRRTFSQKTADVVDKIWQGARTLENQFLWYGLIRGANFSTTAPNLANTPVPQAFPISDSWIRGFIAKNLSFDTANVSYAEFVDIFLQGHLQYDPIIGDASPDLRPFKHHGGKMITWQGLADGTINPQGTQLYYQKVLALDPSAHDFYRQFFSPGVGHCGGGTGVIPIDPIGQLRAWVENGTAPAHLEAGSPYPINASSSAVVDGTNVRFQSLCPYPMVNKYRGLGDPALASSYECAASDGWLAFPGPSGSNYSCFGGPGWYAQSFPSVEI